MKKQILMDNALEAWISAIHYCNEIIEGKTTLGNRKFFVSSLENALELFIKQQMLNVCDYRVANARELSANGEPMHSYLLTENLNEYFYNLQMNDTGTMQKFFSAEFSKLIEWQKGLFEEYYESHPEDKNRMGEGLSLLKELRNNETHFYIDESDFLKESEFVKLYNLMVAFFKILGYYHLLNYFGEAFGENKLIDFQKDYIVSFSYKKQLKNSKSVEKIKRAIENGTFSTESGCDAYKITEDLLTSCKELECFEFDELWAYIQMLLKNKLLSIHDEANEEEIEGSLVYNSYREYRIKI